MSWEKVKLNELCEINVGKTPSRDKPEYFGIGEPWASIADMNGNIYLTTTKEQVTKDGILSANMKLVPENTVIFSFKLSVGKVCITGKPLFTNEAIAALPIKNLKTLDTKYLYYAMKAQDFSHLGERAAKGLTLNKEKLNRIQIPLPPLPIQQKIATILDQADSLRKKDRQLLAKYDELLQSVFYDMFGEPVKNEKGWEKGTIRDVVTEVKYGTSKPAEESGSYPYLRMNNITYSGDWDFSSLKYINLDETEEEKYLLRKNDLVFNRTNSKELVGKTAVYQLDDKMAIAGYLIRVRTNEKANSIYLSAYLNSQHGKAVLMGMCKNIIGMANINAQELQDINILIPPIMIQNQFALIVQNIQQQKQQVKQQMQQSEALFQCLLQWAFKGELVK